ncbi:MAG: GcvT family protein [Ilumatobacteraceae bacterium]
MKDQYRVVVIGGGIVGVSVLYHLARAGWTDIALIERSELTAGSTWHAAAGFHSINDDPNIAALQDYSIGLYKEIEAESGQSVGLRMTGGISLAGTQERWEFLKAAHSMNATLDLHSRLVEPDEIAAMCPIVEIDNVVGGLYEPNEGRLDPHGSTHAFAIAARQRGADVILRNRVLDLVPHPDGWTVVTELGTVRAEHVVNAAGLWARRVGRMAGVDLPLLPMAHHYLVTEDVPELAGVEDLPAITDLEGFTYMQQEHGGVLLGVYETNPRHWMPQGAPWDYGMELIPPDIERISPELSIGFARFPALANVGIRRWVNGALTVTPDGNPLVGPVRGVRNFWLATGCMAGFSQGSAIGVSLANWMVHGQPGFDVFGMDIARFGPFASSEGYLRDTTAQFYARRFIIAYPNEELPAGRPLKVSPAYDALTAEGARFSVLWGMESPSFFAPGDPGFEETPTLRRSNAHELVAAEVAATRTAAGMFETSVYARYEVSGPGARQWLDRVLACRLPAVGRVRLAPMLGHDGALMGDMSVTCLGDDQYWLVGSYSLQEFHQRWFEEHLPPSGVRVVNRSDDHMGFALSGPASAQILAALTSANPAGDDLSFFAARRMSVGNADALVARMSLTGERGYEITVPTVHHRALFHDLMRVGRDLGLRPFGLRALDSLRLEKGYGIWSAEFAQNITPAMSGLDHHVDGAKADFIGRDAFLAAQDRGPAQRLVILRVDAADADATGFEPVWLGERRVGYVTSGAYGHSVGQSLAMAYVDVEVLADAPALEVDIVGERRSATVLDRCPYDPSGDRLKG